MVAGLPLLYLAAATAFCNVKNGCAELPSPGVRVRVRVGVRVRVRVRVRFTTIIRPRRADIYGGRIIGLLC